MPTYMEIYYFWVTSTKRRYFLRLKAYPRLKKRHNDEIISGKEKAMRFRVRWLLSAYFSTWKRNILLPNSKLLKEADSIHNTSLLRRFFIIWTVYLERISELDNVLQGRFEKTVLAKKIAIFTRWLLKARELRRANNALYLARTVSMRYQRSVFSLLLQLFEVRQTLKLTCQQYITRHYHEVVEKIFRLLKEKAKTRKKYAYEVEEAKAFHRTVVRSLDVQIVLRKVLEKAQKQECALAERAAQTAKELYLRYQQERRDEMCRLAFSNDVGARSVPSFYERYDIYPFDFQTKDRHQPVLPQCFNANFDSIHSSLIYQRESLVMDYISKYKQLQQAVEAESTSLSYEREKLHQLYRRLDRTVHPWSCKLEIEGYQAVVQQREIECRRLAEYRDILKQGLREIKGSL